ncbi:MAG: hypothetical protein IIZ93_09705, partial [Acidaminococcaceae bacterium]|nr:hypothetical protein [Acidaminococcaceae bacterium]
DAVRPGADGQTTEELFEKALAEQNGTAVQSRPDNTQKETGSGDTAARGSTDTTQSSMAADGSRDRTDKGVNAGAVQSESTGSSEKKEPEGVIENILYIAGELVDIFGWTVILLAFVIIDGVFLGGFFATLFFEILLSAIFSGGGSGGGGGGSSGGGFGGGSGGGGGSSRSW